MHKHQKLIFMKQILLTLLISFSFHSLVSAQRKPKPTVKDSVSSEAFLKMVEGSLDAYYSEYAGQSDFNSIIDALEKENLPITELTDAVICDHLKKMGELSPFKLDCNAATLSTIKFFAKSRRSFIKIALGRSTIYFDMYEEALARNEMPLELKYLSVIESGLRPQVKSPAGALGLWQFMYGTGKMYGLMENSYIDERMDPVKSTDAACKYLKKLYSIYNDWNLALAAYNAGPGNVNKAIRRSGGKLTYWEVRPFLPRETQGYVPNFIAAAYLMTYYKEHGLEPAPAKIHYAQLDTMCLKQGVHMQTIAKLVDWDVEDVHHLNPVYKTKYIPNTVQKQCITGPLSKIGKLVSLEDSLYKMEQKVYGISARSFTPVNTNINQVVEKDTNEVASNGKESVVYHKVRSGETLTKIAIKHGVTVKQIMTWNGLRSTKAPIGKTLKIIKKVVEVIQTTPPMNENDVYDTIIVITHTVERNESLTVIASKYDVTVDEIKKWNTLSSNWVNIGQKLKIQTKLKMSRSGGVPISTEKLETDEVKEEVKVEAIKPVSKPQYYTIRSGDLFNRIAQKHGLTTAQLKKLNPGVNPDRIREGQKIRIK
jgi:membrane-bound lytic murein transglycosylase D